MVNTFLAINKEHLGQGLKSIDLLIISQIEEFQRSGNCYVTNEQLSEYFGESVSTIKRSLDKLEALGIINRHTVVYTVGKKAKKRRTLTVNPRKQWKLEIIPNQWMTEQDKTGNDVTGHATETDGKVQKMDSEVQKMDTKGSNLTSNEVHNEPIKENIKENIKESIKENMKPKNPKNIITKNLDRINNQPRKIRPYETFKYFEKEMIYSKYSDNFAGETELAHYFGTSVEIINKIIAEVEYDTLLVH